MSTGSTPSVRLTSGPKKSPTPQARLAPSARRSGGQSTLRVAATASSWLAWYSTAASAVRAPRASWCTATQCRSSASCAAFRPSARSSINRRPRCTCPSRRPSGGRRERRARPELERAADVVHERGREQQVAAQPRVELRRLARERRDADRVLEQAARVGVVVLGRRGERCEVAVAEHRFDGRARARGARARRRGTRETRRARPGRAAAPASASAGRRPPPRASARRAAAGRGTSRRGASTRTASPSAKRPSSSSTSFQTRASIAAGRVDELEREVRRAGLRAQLALHADRVDALDDPVLLELRDRHGPSLPPRPDAEAGLVVAPVGDVVEERGRLLPPPAERRRARSAAVSSPVRSSTSVASSRRAAPRAGSRFGSCHLRASRSWASAPQVLPCSTRCELVRTSRWWSDAIVAVDRPSCRAPSPRAAAGRSAGRASRTASTTGSSSAGSPFAATSVGTSRGATHATDAGEVLADAGGARGRKLVLRRPEERSSPATSPRRRPVSARDLLPERRQHDVGLREEEREPDLVDPRGCRGERADHATSLQECPGSARSLRSGTTRRSPARSTRSSRRPYDVISDAQRAEYLARSPYNVVRLTLPDSPEDAARDLAAWREDGVLRGRAAALLVGGAGLHRPGRRRAHARGARARRCRSRRTRTARCCRTSARTPARRRAGCGCCVRRTRSSSRSSCSTTPTRSSSVPAASRRWTSRRAACARASGRSRATSSSSARRS